jgi:hypothetical protein
VLGVEADAQLVLAAKELKEKGRLEYAAVGDAGGEVSRGARAGSGIGGMFAISGCSQAGLHLGKAAVAVPVPVPVPVAGAVVTVRPTPPRPINQCAPASRAHCWTLYHIPMDKKVTKGRFKAGQPYLASP